MRALFGFTEEEIEKMEESRLGSQILKGLTLPYKSRETPFRRAPAFVIEKCARRRRASLLRKFLLNCHER